jgi:hypothetical protein
MPNAYVVSAVTRKPMTSATPDNNNDSGSPQNNNSTMQWGGGATSVYTLANGEQRRRTELPDRCKRLDILARHGLIRSATSPHTSPHKSKRGGAAGAGAGGAYADDAFEGSDGESQQQHDDDDFGSDEFEGRSPSPQKRNSSSNKQNNSHGSDEGAGAAGKFQQCAAVGWSMVKRQVSNG